MNKQYIKKKLEEAPFFRERKNKNLGMAKLILMEYPELAITSLTPEKLTQILEIYATADRLWRKILSEPGNEHLQGRDYHDKDSLEDKKIKELYD